MRRIVTKAKQYQRGMNLAVACLVCLLGALPCGAQTAAREVHVLAASDLQPVMPALAAEFEHASGIKLVLSFGSSATLATQILNGDPVDLFLAADNTFPEKIVAAGLADTPAPIAYARGTLVLWARKDSPLQPLTQNTLRDGKFASLAIANPDHAPYGRAAVAALEWMKVYDAVKAKIVQAENIAQTAQFVESGNAQAGLVALSHALAPAMKDKGRYWTVPLDAYPTLNQAAVVISKSKQQDAAKKFLEFLRSFEASSLLTRYGFSLPSK